MKPLTFALLVIVFAQLLMIFNLTSRVNAQSRVIKVVDSQREKLYRLSTNLVNVVEDWRTEALEWRHACNLWKTNSYTCLAELEALRLEHARQ